MDLVAGAGAAGPARPGDRLAGDAGDGRGPTPPVGTPPVPTNSAPTRFYASVELSHDKAVRQVGTLAEEVLDHLAKPGARVVLRLEVEADNPAGFDDTARRVVSENCRTLNVRDFGFED